MAENLSFKLPLVLVAWAIVTLTGLAQDTDDSQPIVIPPNLPLQDLGPTTATAIRSFEVDRPTTVTPPNDEVQVIDAPGAPPETLAVANRTTGTAVAEPRPPRAAKREERRKPIGPAYRWDLRTLGHDAILTIQRVSETEVECRVAERLTDEATTAGVLQILSLRPRGQTLAEIKMGGHATDALHGNTFDIFHPMPDGTVVRFRRQWIELKRGVPIQGALKYGQYPDLGPVFKP